MLVEIGKLEHLAGAMSFHIKINPINFAKLRQNSKEEIPKLMNVSYLNINSVFYDICFNSIFCDIVIAIRNNSTTLIRFIFKP